MMQDAWVRFYERLALRDVPGDARRAQLEAWFWRCEADEASAARDSNPASLRS